MRNVLIIGDGVIGMSTAALLARCDCNIQVWSTDRLPRTSDVAAAFWFPFACDLTVEQEQLFGKPTLDLFQNYHAQRQPDSGIWLTSAHQFYDSFSSPVDREPRWWFDQCKGEPIPAADLNRAKSTGAGRNIITGWEYELPVVHAATFMRWLKKECGNRVQFKAHEVARLEDLTGKFDVVINCAGGWSGRFWNARSRQAPNLIGIQGVVVRVRDFDHSLIGGKLVFYEPGGNQVADHPIYIVPHGDGQPTVLGGTLDSVENWSWHDDQIDEYWIPRKREIETVIEQCSDLLSNPKLRGLLPWPQDSQIHTSRTGISATARAGLRPKIQNGPPCVGFDDELFDSGFGINVLHNFGHGGSGITLCWGSALQVLDRLIEAGMLKAPPNLDALRRGIL